MYSTLQSRVSNKQSFYSHSFDSLLKHSLIKCNVLGSFLFCKCILTYFYFATDNLLFYYMLKKHSLLWLKKWNKLVNLTLFSGAMPTPGGLLMMWKKSGFYQLTMKAQLWLEQKKLFADLKKNSKMSRVSLHYLGFFSGHPSIIFFSVHSQNDNKFLTWYF